VTDILNNWRRKSAAMSPKQKKMSVVTTVLVVLFGLIYLFSSKSAPAQKKDDKQTVEVVQPSKRNIDVENLNATITALQRQINDAQTRQSQTESKLADALSTLAEKVEKGPSNEDIDRRVDAALKTKGGGNAGAVGDKAVAGPAGLPAPGTTPALGAALPGMVPVAGAAPVSATGTVSRGLQLSGEDEEEEGKEGTTGTVTSGNDKAGKSAKKTPGAWFPMGSILSGVALNGGDFPVSNAARRDPLPMLIRIKKDAFLPNNARASVKECHVIVSGVGSMSTSRADLRAERISCVLDGGRSLELPISGYVVGEDGKPGLHGKLVTKEAETIAKALRVGLIGAAGVGLTGLIGQELSASSGSVNVNFGQNGGGGQSGAAAGAAPIGKSFEKITDYYSSLAKEIVPVVEINPLRQIDIVLVRGLEIPTK
jgi:conjugal transfer pilus assembly protein TraB